MSKTTTEQFREALADLADQLERGDVKAASIEAVTKAGDIEVYHLSVDSEEERQALILSIRQALGQVH